MLSEVTTLYMPVHCLSCGQEGQDVIIIGLLGLSAATKCNIVLSEVTTLYMPVHCLSCGKEGQDVIIIGLLGLSAAT